jgi:hypothetical protein
MWWIDDTVEFESLLTALDIDTKSDRKWLPTFLNCCGTVTLRCNAKGVSSDWNTQALTRREEINISRAWKIGSPDLETDLC